MESDLNITNFLFLRLDFLFWSFCTACGILSIVPQPGTDPAPSVLEVQS